MIKIVCVFLMLYCSAFGQLKVNYYKIQNKYGSSIEENTFSQKKIIKDSETAVFLFSKIDSLLLGVSFTKPNAYTEAQFEELKTEYVENFKPSKTKSWENLLVYFDEKRNIMIIKFFEDTIQRKIIGITFMTDSKEISGFLSLFENSH